MTQDIKELLELAAKACGGLVYVDSVGSWIHVAEDGTRGAWWNPSIDDGDGEMMDIYDLMRLPERRLHIKQLLAVGGLRHPEGAIQASKEQAAKVLTAKILEQPDFFSTERETVGGIEMVKIESNCIVVTSDEFHAMRRRIFEEAIDHVKRFQL